MINFDASKENVKFLTKCDSQKNLHFLRKFIKMFLLNNNLNNFFSAQQKKYSQAIKCLKK